MSSASAAQAIRAFDARAAMLTILFDGIAYGMLLFLIASGLAVTLGLMNFVNLAHGAFAMAGGYLASVLSNRMGVPFLATLPLAFLLSARAGRAARADALPAALRAAAPRPGAVLDRPRVHGGGGDRLLLRRDAAVRQAAAVPDRTASRSPASASASTGCSSSSSAASLAVGLQLDADAHALRQPAARGRRRPARRAAASASTSTSCILATFAFGSGLAGLGGALGAELLGLDPTFPLKYMIYFLDRRRRRRHDDDHRAAASRRCCSASPTSPASTTCRSSARSSSTA